MTRISLSALLASAMSLSASGALAQTVTLQVSQLDGEGGLRTEQEQIAFGLNAVDCEGGATISVIPNGGVSSIPSGINQVDLWVGSGDCSPAMARNPDSATCFNAGTATIDSTTGTFEVTLSALNAAKSSICGSTAQQGTDHTVYALLTNESVFTGEITDFGTFTLKVDVVAPEAPTIEEGKTTRKGDSMVTIEWELVDDARVFYDVVDGGNCETGSPNLSDVIESSGLNSTSANINPADDLDLMDGELAAVYVVGRDEAGNIGEASVEICIERVPVAGFCDVLGECGDGGCSIGGTTSGSAACIWLAMIGLGLVRRRGR